MVGQLWTLLRTVLTPGPSLLNGESEGKRALEGLILTKECAAWNHHFHSHSLVENSHMRQTPPPHPPDQGPGKRIYEQLLLPQSLQRTVTGTWAQHPRGSHSSLPPLQGLSPPEPSGGGACTLTNPPAEGRTTPFTPKKCCPQTSLVVQWLKLRAPKAEGLASIPDQGTRSHTTTKIWQGQINFLKSYPMLPYIV